MNVIELKKKCVNDVREISRLEEMSRGIGLPLRKGGSFIIQQKNK